MESRPAFDSSVIIEDYFASPLPKQNTLIASTPLKIANLIRLGNEFAWEGSLESLKEFIKDKFKHRRQMVVPWWRDKALYKCELFNEMV